MDVIYEAPKHNNRTILCGGCIYQVVHPQGIAAVVPAPGEEGGEFPRRFRRRRRPAARPTLSLTDRVSE